MCILLWAGTEPYIFKCQNTGYLPEIKGFMSTLLLISIVEPRYNSPNFKAHLLIARVAHGPQSCVSSFCANFWTGKYRLTCSMGLQP